MFKPALQIRLSLILVCGISAGFWDISGHSGAQAPEVADSAAASFLEPDPPSTILPKGKSTLELTIRSAQPTDCRYSLGTPFLYESMMPFTSGQGTALHKITLKGLNTDPSFINHVYIRCAAQPEELLHLRYRCLPRANPSYPRTGNIWGSWRFKDKGMAYCARIDLWLGADFSPSEIVQLRALNPDILILKSINAVENVNLPDSYYLKDIHGQRIEVWPKTYRLNLTKTVVAEYQARYAYQCMLDPDPMTDGCFFDNFFTSQSWLTHDIYGRRVRIDADEDGKEDDPKWLDAAWRRGVFHELKTWRRWMPYAIASGHLPLATEPGVADIFNGDSIGFTTADVLDGKTAFTEAWKEYNDWIWLGRAPHIIMIESTPPDQIAYGYGYDPAYNIPASTLEFARTYYPYVRFGLGLTLMNNGYFAHEFGDIDHGQDWWYDELDFDLGIPFGPARRVPSADNSPNPNLIENSGFEKPLDGTWFLLVYEADGTKATAQRDFQEKADGTASAQITVKSLGQGVDWHVAFEQRDRSLQKGQVYALSFMAKANRPNRTIRLYSQQAPPGSRGYGLWAEVRIGINWQKYQVLFEALETVSDARIEFFLGMQKGDVWLDNVRLVRAPDDIYRRDFTNGIVLLNGTKRRVTAPLGGEFVRLKGPQAPCHQRIIDDEGNAFSTRGDWQKVTIDSGEWKAAGPYYHDWGPSCHRQGNGGGGAEWILDLIEDGIYTIQAWWPAALEASQWTRNAVYEIIQGASIVTSVKLDQTQGGDEWHTIATVPLSANGAPSVRLRSGDGRVLIADALHFFSNNLYNDGSTCRSVTLEPLDGIVVRRHR